LRQLPKIISFPLTRLGIRARKISSGIVIFFNYILFRLWLFFVIAEKKEKKRQENPAQNSTNKTQ
jgi:cell division protein FtsI/penicillin-binding protein 2